MARRNADDTSGAGEHVLTIGELAEQSGVSAEAIRYYEREGVLPAPARSGPGRYRRYRPADAERLRFVRRARALGFSLHEVRELLSLASGDPGEPCTDVNRVAQAHLDQVEDKIARLTALRAELANLMRGCGGTVPVGECRILEALGRPERR